MLEELYEFFKKDWQDEYGPRPEECVPGMDSEEFKLWLDNERY